VLRLVLFLFTMVSSFAFAADEPNCDPNVGLVDGACFPGEPVHDPCNGISGRDHTECAGQKFEKADANLNQVYRRLMAALPNDGDSAFTKAKLRNEQRKWVRWKESHCSKLGQVEGGSDSWKAAFTTDCWLAVTTNRTKQLLAILKRTDSVISPEIK
jgi:uncharacterized protein YecT (DUF1311 family)